MDFWASLEHKIHYKFEGKAPEHIKRELVECAMMVSDLDARMLSLNEEIQALATSGEEEEPEFIETEESALLGENEIMAEAAGAEGQFG
jgi:putative GTP pyrophosphokinase